MSLLSSVAKIGCQLRIVAVKNSGQIVGYCKTEVFGDEYSNVENNCSDYAVGREARWQKSQMKGLAIYGGKEIRNVRRSEDIAGKIKTEKKDIVVKAAQCFNR